MALCDSWTLAYTAASNVPDPLLGAAVAQQDYFEFLPTFATVQVLRSFNLCGCNIEQSGGYIRVPARVRRI